MQSLVLNYGHICFDAKAMRFADYIQCKKISHKYVSYACNFKMKHIYVSFRVNCIFPCKH